MREELEGQAPPVSEQGSQTPDIKEEKGLFLSQTAGLSKERTAPRYFINEIILSALE